jgi:phosphohistidine phosphatase SixA/ketosteroid isomerase-like protein
MPALLWCLVAVAVLALRAAAQDLPAVELRAVDGTETRCVVQLPPDWSPPTWVPLLVVFADGTGETAARAAVAAAAAAARAGFVIVAPVRPEDGHAADPSLFAWLRRTFRIDQGGMHAALHGADAAMVATWRRHRHQFQSVTWLGDALPAPRLALRGSPARRVFGPLGVDELGAHVVRVHAERALSGAAGAVARALDDFHDAAAVGDASRYFALLPDDAVFLGTDGTERWTGERFRAFAQPYFERGSAWTYVCLARQIDVDAGGQFAAFDETLDHDAYGECRGSGVLVRRGGRWVLRQYHLSIPVPNGAARAVAARIAAFHDGIAAATTMVVVVRHAEKADASADPPLSEAGRRRADELARALREVPFAAVYTSELRRTAETVAPLCAAQALTAQVVRAAESRAVAARIRSDHRGGAVLVCGHSNTVPEILQALGVPEPVAIADDEYDRLFVVALTPDGARLLALRYGAR